MSRVAYRPTPAFQVANNVRIACMAHRTPLTSLSQLGRKWTPTLAIWGAGAGVMALYVRALGMRHTAPGD